MITVTSVIRRRAVNAIFVAVGAAVVVAFLFWRLSGQTHLLVAGFAGFVVLLSRVIWAGLYFPRKIEVDESGVRATYSNRTFRFVAWDRVTRLSGVNGIAVVLVIESPDGDLTISDVGIVGDEWRRLSTAIESELSARSVPIMISILEWLADLRNRA
jgi:hypothetical protein